MSDTLLELEDVVVLHRTDPTGLFGLWGAKPIRAVDGVSLSLEKGETLGLMGGSGAGKTTLAEAAALRRSIDRGRIRFQGEDVKNLDRKRTRRRLQIIRQDVRESLDMDRTVRKQLSDAVKEYQLPDGEARIARALAQVEMPPDEFLDRTPKQMSGGQQQRVAIARALVLNPLAIALDEPVAAVDPHLREELYRLLERVQKRQGTAYLLISQDPRTISRLAHRVAIMHEGKIIEVGPTQQVLGEPLHPFSRRLLGREEGLLPAEEDMAGRAYQGCPWAAHCSVKADRCDREAPTMRKVAPGRFVACHVL